VNQFGEPLNRPFPRGIWDSAREIVQHYQLVLHFEDGEWYGRGLEFPTAMSDGKTPNECVRNTRESLTIAVATMLEDGEAPPPPARDGKRTEQVNLRLTVEEKLALENSARALGYDGLSDYVRTAALTGKAKPERA
jgi:predicted RNase H-like HicB family nuclease